MNAINKIYKSISNFVIGDKEKFEIQHRIFSSVVFFSGIFGLISVMLAPLIEEENFYADDKYLFFGRILVLSFTLSCTYFFILSRFFGKYKNNILPFNIVILISISSLYFINAGITGPNFFLIILGYLFMGIVKEKNRIFTFALYLLTAIVLVIIEYINPDLVVRYSDHNSLIFEIAIVFIITFILIHFTFSMLLKVYNDEKNKVIKQRDEIEIKNQELEKSYIHVQKLQEALSQDLNKSKQQALKAQINPHFIFNTLSSIQYYIQKNDKKESTRYLNMFSDLMRKTLDNSFKTSISLEEELSALQLYLQLEALRFDDRFNFEINIPPDVDIFKIEVPSLLIQPYVENAVWHGILHKREQNGYIKINIIELNDKIQCVIDDNGIGREKAKEIKAKKANTYKSHGMKINEDRINLLKIMFDKPYNINIIDKKDNDGNALGTTVVIDIPR